MKCPDCDEEMILTECPQEIFAIPFTRFSIWDMGKKEYVCLYCADEKEHERERAIYEQAGEEAYRRGLKDGYKELI